MKQSLIVFSDEEKVALRAFIDLVELRAERYMLQTHKLEGMHYRAMMDLKKEFGI